RRRSGSPDRFSERRSMTMRRANSGTRLLGALLASLLSLTVVLTGVPAAVAEDIPVEPVRAFWTGDWTPPAGDPSGVVKVGNNLVIVDSEVEEAGCFAGDVNLWEVSADDPSAVIRAARLSTDEPSGIGFGNGFLFVSDDEENVILVYDYGNPGDEVATIDVSGILGQQGIPVGEVEDPAFDATTGDLFAVGLATLPGPEDSPVTKAVVFHITSDQDDFSSNVSIDILDVDHLLENLSDTFEGLAVDPDTGNLFLGAQKERRIYEIDPSDPAANPVNVVDVSGLVEDGEESYGLLNISGLEVFKEDGETRFWVA